MNSRERITKILQHKEADYVPVYPLINSISRNYVGIDYEEWSKDYEKCAEAIIKATDELDVDVICSLVDLSVEAEGFGMEVVYYKDQAASPSENKFINNVEEYSKVVAVDPRETKRMGDHIKMVKILKEKRGDSKPIVGFVFAPLGVLSMLTGLTALMKDCIKNKAIVHEAVKKVSKTILDYSLALVEAGCDAIMFDTLFASKTIMRGKMWDEFEGVYMEDIANKIHEAGAMVMIHNCGGGIYFKEQIDRMKPEAISFLHYPPDCASMEELKEKYGNVTTLIGHVDPGYLMACTEEDLRKLCRGQIDAYKKDGGFILATGCEFPALLDDTFAKVMIEEAKTYGKY